MISKSMVQVLSRAGRMKTLGVCQVLGTAVAVGVTLLSALVGAILYCMELGKATALSEAVDGDKTIGLLLPNAASMLPATFAPMARLSLLLGAALVLVFLIAGLLVMYYRQVQNVAVHFELAIIEQLREHARRLATSRTLSAQQQALTDCLSYHLPRVRISLARYWRTIPRHIVQLVGCLLVAALIHPLLVLLVVIAATIVLLWYRFMDSRKRTQLPVVRERASQQRETLIEICLRGPLIESVHNRARVDEKFSEQVNHYRQDAAQSLTSSVWKTPTLVLGVGAVTLLFLFVVAVQVLSGDGSMGISGACAFAVSFCCAGVSLLRIQGTRRELSGVESAADELERFLALSVPEWDEESLADIDRVEREVALDHVTVLDSKGRKLLEDLSLSFKPGQLIGIVATQSIQAHALAELLLGLGRPASGRMLFDGQLVTDLKPSSIINCAHWIGAEGAVVTGSLQENLIAGDARDKVASIDEALKEFQLSDLLHRLPEGLATLITADDDRFSGDDRFRIGIARAALNNASIYVVEEPESRYNEEIERDSLAAIKHLVRPEAITVVLPQRISTVRDCDVVVMLDGHKIAGIGSHADLIQANEFYRHLTYLRFNPFRGTGG